MEKAGSLAPASRSAQQVITVKMGSKSHVHQEPLVSGHLHAAIVQQAIIALRQAAALVNQPVGPPLFIVRRAHRLL